jgi:hypothetical protein
VEVGAVGRPANLPCLVPGVDRANVHLAIMGPFARRPTAKPPLSTRAPGTGKPLGTEKGSDPPVCRRYD